MNVLGTADRKALIRLAGSLPTGSDERKAILSALQKIMEAPVQEPDVMNPETDKEFHPCQHGLPCQCDGNCGCGNKKQAVAVANRYAASLIPRGGREFSYEGEDAWVVIGNYGRGVQTMWPSSKKPRVYSKREAEKLAKDMNAEPKHAIGSFVDNIHWHAQPLDKALRYAPTHRHQLEDMGAAF